jgi:hypothetical protein
MPEKRARFNREGRLRDADIVVQKNQPPRHGANGKEYKGDCKRVWVPVKRTESKSASSKDLDAADDSKLGEHRPDDGVAVNLETSNVVGQASNDKEARCVLKPEDTLPGYRAGIPCRDTLPGDLLGYFAGMPCQGTLPGYRAGISCRDTVPG